MDANTQIAVAREAVSEALDIGRDKGWDPNLEATLGVASKALNDQEPTEADMDACHASFSHHIRDTYGYPRPT